MFLPGLIFITMLTTCIHAERHQHHALTRRQSSSSGRVPLSVVNHCGEDIYPGIISETGTGPGTTGFLLSSGATSNLTVSSDWQGRVWGRTNCSFTSSGQSSNSGSSACSTGDCGALECQIAGNPPATLAEFTLQGSSSQTFYDISLVDGYNIPVAIVVLPNGNSQVEALSSNETNPSCVASIGDIAGQNFNPYANGQSFLGTSSQDPLAFQTTSSASDISDWCPWDLQVDAPLAPGDGVYPYPDGSVTRPAFDPCLSACAKYDEAQYCCTGSYDSPSSCGPNYYSKVAKTVCPDAYSYAYDDTSSTFIIPQGAGFQVIFCPGGRSTNIIAAKAGSTSSAPATAHTGFSLDLGWCIVDGRALKAAMASVLTVLVVLTF